MCVVRWVDDVVIKILEPKNEEKHLVSLKERNQLKRNIPESPNNVSSSFGPLHCVCWLVMGADRVVMQRRKAPEGG
jgi:hypothetical protein